MFELSIPDLYRCRDLSDLMDLFIVLQLQLKHSGSIGSSML